MNTAEFPSPEARVTNLLAMSFDRLASPSIRLKGVKDGVPELDAGFGWGFAWYPGGGNAALVIKDPTSRGDNALTSVLSDWDHFSSNVFICHLRGAAKRISQRDVHPFTRSLGGKDWVFAHNGDLLPGYRDTLPIPDSAPFTPVGTTDSEHAFCWLLNRLRENDATCIHDVGYEQFRAWIQEINRLGTVNLLVSDGENLVVHTDMEAFLPLHWTRRVPPRAALEYENREVAIRLASAAEELYSAILISTDPLSDDEWTRMKPGQTMVVRGSRIVWQSDEAHVPTSDFAALQEQTTAAPVEAAITLHSNASGQTANLPFIAADRSKGRTRLAFPYLVSYMRAPVRALYTTHETTYTYEDEPVEHSEHLFRLRPVHQSSQHLLWSQLDVTPACSQREFFDVFDNPSVFVEITQPYHELKIVARSLVLVTDVDDRALSRPLRRDTIPFVWMPWQRQMMSPYLLPTELPETQLRVLSDYATSFMRRNRSDLMDTLQDINRTIYEDYEYLSHSTTLETTPFDVYVNRRGVCQDFANLFICLARLMGIPARYRVGYIFTGGKYENPRQGDASHAWAEAYVPNMGWVGFDPTNGILVSSDHVVVACGRNYRDATPTSGTLYRGGKGEKLSVLVKVVDVTQDIVRGDPPLP